MKSPGQIILPTGTGKTFIALEKTRKIVTSPKKKSKQFIGVVFVPRIILALQWIREAAQYLIKQHNLPFNFININSGKLSSVIKTKIETFLYDNIGPGVVPIISTTRPADVRKQVNHLLDKNYHVLIICTYHSNHVLRNANLPIAVAFYDESQCLPGNAEFAESINIDCPKYFMTATPVTTDSDDGTGMNNEQLYGPVIYTAKPRIMIEVGAIVSPKVHIVGIENRIRDKIERREFNSLSSMIFDSHKEHKLKIKKTSYVPKKIGSKLLIVCNGQLNLMGMFESREFRTLSANNPNVKIFGLSTDFGIYYNNHRYRATSARKEEFLNCLYELKPNDEALILHVDMIGEGLDVPGITGVLFLRNVKKIKFLQNLGRATRLHPEDARRMEEGKLKAGDLDKYIKPHCYIILPHCLDDSNDDFVEHKYEMLYALRSDYDFDPSENIIVDILNPAQKGPDFDEDDLERQIRSIHTAIPDFYHLIEDNEAAYEEMILKNKLFKCLGEDNPGIIKIISV